ncbi:MAG: hypothetical protein Fur0018_05000 [Anaerolineales bacterium]
MPQDQDRVLDILRKSHLFVGLDNDALRYIATRFRFTHYKKGELICRKGEDADRFYLVYRGKVRIWQQEGENERFLATLIPGDYFGEEGLLHFTHRRSANVSAYTDPTTLAYLDEPAFKSIIQVYPQVHENLKLMVRSRQMARAARFDWLGEDESTYLVARKHNTFLWLYLLPVIVMGLAALLLMMWGRSTSLEFMLWAGIAGLVVTFLWGIWRYVDWGNDYYIVTNQRVIWLEKIIGLYESRQEAPLHVIHSVNTHTTQIGRLLGYGDVVVHTFTSSIQLRHISDPGRVAALINEHWKRAQERQKLAQEISMRRTVRSELKMDPEQASLPIGVPWPPKPLPPPKVGNSFWDHINIFKMRFEEGDRVTYRKHWLILLYKTWVPGLLILAVFTISIIGWFNLIAGLLTIIGLSVWWGYQYVDWRNDIYQVTADKLYDVERRPLGSEHRKEAPLENVLSIKVDRHGFTRILFNFGNVVIDVSGSKFTFNNIFNPAQAQQDIFWHMDALKRKKQADQENQDFKRMSRWLRIYHEETHPGPKSDSADEYLPG